MDKNNTKTPELPRPPKKPNNIIIKLKKTIIIKKCFKKNKETPQKPNQPTTTTKIKNNKNNKNN